MKFFEKWGSLEQTWEYKAARVAVATQLLVSGGALLWFWRALPPRVPLWYSKPWGEERLASPFFLFLLPLTAILVYGVNRIAVGKAASDHPIFARVLFLSSSLVSFLSIIVVLRIITLIT